ncbi:MAG TPA: hypothetical protein VF458_10800 [Ktedonobacteraceae bacterium]
MEINRDKITETGDTPSIRLRYSRQFQSGGHAHTIDAEAALSVGSSPEKREQVIRELESSVEQLARQITRGSRPLSEAQPQIPARPAATANRGSETPAPAPPTRPVPPASQPTAPLPISESMPAAPTPGGERTISLPYFIDFIKKRWNMSAQDAMELLEVRELSGLNLREALFKLRTIKEPNAGQDHGSASARSRTTPPPVVEAPRQASRGMSPAPDARPPASAPAPNTTPVPRAQSAAALQHETQAMPRAPQSAPAGQRAYAKPPESAAPERERESRPEFAGSPKAPLPIQMGVVRDLSPRSYAFEEEEEEEYELPGNTTTSSPHLQAAESKLEELKTIRGDKVVSPERLTVLNNVIGEQLAEEQLRQLIKMIWNQTSKKRLKGQQVEALISWAKEDYFLDEVENLLTLVDDEEVE